MVKIKLILATVAFQVAASSVAFEFENPFKPKDEMKELFIKNPKAYWDRIYNFKWENINGQFIYDKNAFAKNVHGIALMRIQVNARWHAREFPKDYDYTTLDLEFDCEQKDLRVAETNIVTTSGPKLLKEGESSRAWTRLNEKTDRTIIEAFRWACGKAQAK